MIERLWLQIQLAPEKAAGPAGVDDELCIKLERLTLPRSREAHLVEGYAGRDQIHFIEVNDPQVPGLLNQVLVEVGPVPVHIGDGIARAGADQELASADWIGTKGPIPFVVVEGETAFEAAGELRGFPLPRAPLAQRPHTWQCVLTGKFLQQQIGQRRRGFSNDKPGVFSSLDQRRGEPQPTGDHGCQ